MHEQAGRGAEVSLSHQQTDLETKRKEPTLRLGRDKHRSCRVGRVAQRLVPVFSSARWGVTAPPRRGGGGPCWVRRGVDWGRGPGRGRARASTGASDSTPGFPSCAVPRGAPSPLSVLISGSCTRLAASAPPAASLPSPSAVRPCLGGPGSGAPGGLRAGPVVSEGFPDPPDRAHAAAGRQPRVRTGTRGESRSVSPPNLRSAFPSALSRQSQHSGTLGEGPGHRTRVPTMGGVGLPTTCLLLKLIGRFVIKRPRVHLKQVRATLGKQEALFCWGSPRTPFSRALRARGPPPVLWGNRTTRMLSHPFC